MAIFEAPIAHEAGHPYSFPEHHPEFEDEWEATGGHAYSFPEHHPEFEDEWEATGGHAYRFPKHHPEFEDEWEATGGHAYTTSEHHPEFEDESEDELLGNILSGIGGLFGSGEVGANHYTTPEMEYEADLFFKRIGRAIKRVSKVVAPLARRLAPIATKALVGMIPGVGAIAAPLAGQLVGSLVSEAEMEVAEMENHFTNTYAETGEAEHPEVHEALLSELLAANAVGAPTEAEAEAEIGATIPLTIRVMRAGRSVLPVTPALVQANVRLVKTLRRQGQGGRELMRLLPTINRLAVAILNRAARLQRLTSPLAVRAMAVATNRVMSNPRTVRKAVQRNMALRVRAQAAKPRGRLPLRPSPRRRQVRV